MALSPADNVSAAARCDGQTATNRIARSSGRCRELNRIVTGTSTRRRIAELQGPRPCNKTSSCWNGRQLRRLAIEAQREQEGRVLDRQFDDVRSMIAALQPS